MNVADHTKLPPHSADNECSRQHQVAASQTSTTSCRLHDLISFRHNRFMASPVIKANLDEIKKTLAEYQTERHFFTQNTAELFNPSIQLTKKTADIFNGQLHPLLNDKVPGIQMNAIIALSQMIANEKIVPSATRKGIDGNQEDENGVDGSNNRCDGLAMKLLDENIVKEKIAHIADYPKKMRVYLALLLRRLAGASVECAERVVEQGGVEVCSFLIERKNPMEKSYGLWALMELFQWKTDDGLLAGKILGKSNQLVKNVTICCCEPDEKVRYPAWLCLAQITKHNGSTAQNVINAEGIEVICKQWKKYVTGRDCSDEMVVQNLTYLTPVLAQFLKQDEGTVQTIQNEINIIPDLLVTLLNSDSERLRANAVSCIYAVVKHPNWVKKFFPVREDADEPLDNVPMLQSIIPLLNDEYSQWQVCKIVSCLAKNHSSVVIQNGLLPHITDLFQQHDSLIIRKEIIHCIITIAGKDAWKRCQAVLDCGWITLLLSQKSTDAGYSRTVKKAIETLIQECKHFQYLENIFKNPHNPFYEQCMAHLSEKLLPKASGQQKKSFVKSGHLSYFQTLKSSSMEDVIKVMFRSFPVELVNMHDPGYEKKLMAMIEREG